MSHTLLPRSGHRRLALAMTSLLALGAGGCVNARVERLGPGEEPTLIGPAVRGNRTPMDPALACLGAALAKRGSRPLVIGVGDVRDYTGKYSVSEGNAITQGGALMVYSALGKLGGAVLPAERFDPTVAERELGYTDRRQLGDGQAHDVPGTAGKVPWLPYFGGTIAASDYYIIGGITELNYNVRSRGFETGVQSVGPKARTFTQSVAVDLRIVDTRSLLVVKTVSLTKQFTGYEVGFNLFRFFGSNLFDINVGAKAQEPLQLGIRTALEEAALQLVAGVAKMDPAPCLSLGRPGVIPALVSAQTASDSAARAGEALASQTAALNSITSKAGSARSFQLLFEPGSSELTGAAAATLSAFAAASETAPAELLIVARESETLDPAARDLLTDQRIAALVRALIRHGVPESSFSLLWRPARGDPAVRRTNAGEQELARLRVQR